MRDDHQLWYNNQAFLVKNQAVTLHVQTRVFVSLGSQDLHFAKIY